MCALKSPAMAVFGNMLTLCKFPKCQREGIRSFLQLLHFIPRPFSSTVHGSAGSDCFHNPAKTSFAFFTIILSGAYSGVLHRLIDLCRIQSIECRMRYGNLFT